MTKLIVLTKILTIYMSSILSSFFPKPLSFLWSISGKCPLCLWWIHGTRRLDTHSVMQLNFGSLCDGHCTCPWRGLAELLILTKTLQPCCRSSGCTVVQ